MRSASLGTSGQSRTPPSPPPRASGRPMPDRAAVRRRGAPEKRVQAAIRRALSVLGFQVYDLTQPRATKMPIGLPDLYARHRGWRIRLGGEVKAGRPQPTPAQAAGIAGG